MKCCTRCVCRKDYSEAWELKELLKDQQEDAEEGFENTMQNKDLKEDSELRTIRVSHLKFYVISYNF